MILLGTFSQAMIEWPIARRFPVESMSLNLKERDSTASIVPMDMTGISVGKWLQDETDPGKGIVWRVRSIGRAYATQTPTVQLEHIISTLKDRVLFGEVTPATITGIPNATTCTALQAVRYVLSKQSDWTLGEMLDEYQDVSNGYKFDGDTLLDALGTISETLDDCFWTYNTEVYPFRLNLTRGMPSQSIGNEGQLPILRASRNVVTLNTNTDRSQMYTRIYPIGKDDMKLPEQYIEMNTAMYGVIEHVETNAAATTEEELRAWAEERLEHHARPVFTIDVDGLELYKATGETGDRFILGRLCELPGMSRMAMGDTLANVRIIGLSYSDKIGNPERVKITLSNNRADITKIVADTIKKTSKGSRVANRQNKETREILYNTVKDVQIVASGNGYKLQYKLVKDTDWTDGGNFSRAVTGWSVSVPGTGTIRVTAKPQDQYKDVKVRGTTGAWNGNVYSGPIQYSSDDGKTWASTKTNYSVDATVRYNAGWDNAAGMSSSPPAGNTGTTFSYSYPKHYEKNPGKWVREKITENLEIKKGTPSSSGYATVVRGSALIARINIGDWWTAGWDNASALSEAAPAQVSPSGDVTQFTYKYPVTETVGGVVTRHQVTDTMSLNNSATPSASGYVTVTRGGALIARVNVGNWFTYGLPEGIDVGPLTNVGTSVPSGATLINGHSPQYIKNNFSGYGYLRFPVTVHGKTKYYYFPFDNR